ncbi:hypothetical protein [Muricoccus radiodurans]
MDATITFRPSRRRRSAVSEAMIAFTLALPIAWALVEVAAVLSL